MCLLSWVSMNITVDIVKRKEIRYLTNLFFEDLNKEEDNFFTQFTTKQEMIEVLRTTQKDLFFLIKHKGNICGYMSLRGLDDGYKNPRFGIYIFSEYRNKNIAKTAMENLFLFCERKRNFLSIDLIVDKDNIKAVSLYKSLGFKSVNENGRNINMIKMLNVH